jgi:hypothetical protein
MPFLCFVYRSSVLDRAFLKSYKELKGQVGVGGIEASGSRKEAVFRFGKEAKQDVIDDSHNMSGGVGLEMCAVFLQGYIPAVMQTIFDLPIRAKHTQELVRSNLFGRQAGDSIHDLTVVSPGFQSGDLSFEFEDLLMERPIQEINELAAGGNGT